MIQPVDDLVVKQAGRVVVASRSTPPPAPEMKRHMVASDPVQPVPERSPGGVELSGASGRRKKRLLDNIGHVA